MVIVVQTQALPGSAKYMELPFNAALRLRVLSYKLSFDSKSSAVKVDHLILKPKHLCTPCCEHSRLSVNIEDWNCSGV